MVVLSPSRIVLALGVLALLAPTTLAIGTSAASPPALAIPAPDGGASAAWAAATADLANGGGPAAGIPMTCQGTGIAASATCGPSASPVSSPVWTPGVPASGPLGTMIYDHEDRYVVFITQSGTTWTFAKGVWSELQGRTPGAGNYLVVADDRADGYLLLYYGFCGHPCSHTWTFRGGVWKEIQPLHDPGVASEPAMAYDPIDGYVVYLDSTRSTGTTCFTWIFVRGDWSNLCPATSPLPRNDAGMVFDGHDGYVLLFGGTGPTSINGGGKAPHNDTWAFVHGSWTKLSTPVAPPPQDNPAMTYDNATGSVLLVNGPTGGALPIRGFWSFSGGVWTNLSDPLPQAEPFSVVYDYTDHELLLSAHSCYTRGLYGTQNTIACPMLYAYANGTWTNLSATYEVATGATLSTSAMTYDWADQELLAVGNSQDYCNGCSTTYTFRNGSWSTAAAPSFGSITAMTYDPHDGYVLLLAGSSTWTFRAGVWSLHSLTRTPPVLSGEAMTYDNADGYVLLFDDGWTWNYSGGAWTNLSSTVTGSPGYRTGPILVNDTADGYVVLAGGYSGPYLGNRNDTWSYRAGVWTKLATNGTPPVLRSSVVADDPSLGAVVVAGVPGFNYSSNTWLWQTDVYVNGTWSISSTGTQPDQLLGAGAYDPTVGGVFVFLPFNLYTPLGYPTFWTFGEPTLYPVTIYGKGLPATQNWTLTATPLVGAKSSVGGAGTGHRFYLPNGSYTFRATAAGRFLPSATQWSLSVDGGPVAYTLPYVQRYPVSFSGSGLPAGTSWTLEVDGARHSTTSGWVNLTLPNGTYGFTVLNVSGHALLSNGFGYLTVAGRRAVIAVRFA